MEQFFETRIKQQRDWAIIEYLIKWKNLLVEYPTWEYEFIQNHPQQIKHCKKNLFEGKGHVKP